MAANSPLHSPLDRTQALSQLFETIDGFERSLRDELPRNIFPKRKNSDRTHSIPKEEQEVPKKKKREKSKKTEDDTKEREGARSVSPLLYFLTEETLQERVTPEPDRIILPNRFLPMCSDHLGPGCYNLPRPRISKESFSVLPRFPLLDSSKVPITPAARVLTPNQKKDVLQRIRRNIDSVDLYKPVNFRLKLKEKAVKGDFRANVCRLARKEIEESAKRKHQDDLSTKFRRYEWRMRSDEIMEGKRLWAGLLYYMGSLGFWYRKQVKRKALHFRSQNVLKFLLLMTISVGKIAHKVRVKRYRRATVILKRLVPFAARWMRRKKMRMRESIVETIEASLSMDIFYKIITTWKRRIILIQRAVKSWLLRRRAYKLLLLQCWNVTEAALPSKQKLVESPPEPVKVMFLDLFLKSKLKAFLFEVENWRARCETIEENYKKLVYETLDDPPPPPKMPAKPVFPTFLNTDEVLSLLAQAEKKKFRWARIVKENRRIPHRKESVLDPGD